MELEITSSGNSFRAWLQTELTERCRKNPRYSLRSFAAALDIDASSLSKIILGKRKPTAKVIEKLCDKLGCSPIQKQKFLNASKGKTKSLPDNQDEFYLMAEDAYQCMNNWYHAAILELTYTDSFQEDAVWIARTLGITVTETQIALERLKRLKLLSDAEGKLVKTHRSLTNFVPGLTSPAHREYQRQVVQKALNAIDESGPQEKDITSMTMAIDEAKIPEARKLIAKFRRDLCAFLEDGEQTRVFNLAIQLYPLSKKDTL